VLDKIYVGGIKTGGDLVRYVKYNVSEKDKDMI